ncbi:flavin reductase (DIM6/NTAB) family NADH-FMN oxidoreductase RutF [Rhodothalassium salexigens DSM 2132]|uniref:Flavin reductase (DIM6/NTAB) family NADH-FMN oxidoreductase RutF n=2 Tax=Rhodothalassium salexigens TaxID=1086 RepID=A0A4R2PIN9_RHOSA|nr:flavin reductase family protein [Rhodothalassium salexigens]MBB4211423.1 flavin reductase (DIM6/NTAB) family NADH-FMN oxidoreductase RutF [Rhodothalassium salexigens DSM 2132]MBK1637754.1 hypothetical protein [Rhodothalassium salexigens DSM 2132]TCP35343.1 flavin reductase (DIM6/NTAB) family NADH-FMN oxidoreductase RutF [Rhodothalassium salexigens DSM 2132]
MLKAVDDMPFHPLTDPGEADLRAYRNALGRYPTGVAIVIAGGGGYQPVGITINSFASVSLDPPLVLWSVERSSSAVDAFTHAPGFTISILAADQGAIARQFATSKHSPAERLIGAPLADGPGGVPMVEDAAARFDCHLEATFPGGDHVIIVGRVHHFDYDDGQTLLFQDGGFGAAG